MGSTHPHGALVAILGSSRADSTWVRSSDVLLTACSDQKIWVNWNQTRTVCLCHSVPMCVDSFLCWLQTGDEMYASDPNEPYLLKNSQKVRRSPHPPRISSNTLFSQHTFGLRTLPQRPLQSKVREWRQAFTKSSTSRHFLSLGLEWNKNISKHISSCKPPPYFYLKSQSLISSAPRIFFTMVALPLPPFQ